MTESANYIGTISMGSITVKNSKGKDYVVTNPTQFLQHLEEAHGSGNSSTHVENGNSFYVTQWFYQDVKQKVGVASNFS